MPIVLKSYEDVVILALYDHPQGMNADEIHRATTVPKIYLGGVLNSLIKKNLVQSYESPDWTKTAYLLSNAGRSFAPQVAYRFNAAKENKSAVVPPEYADLPKATKIEPAPLPKATKIQSRVPANIQPSWPLPASGEPYFYDRTKELEKEVAEHREFLKSLPKVGVNQDDINELSAVITSLKSEIEELKARPAGNTFHIGGNVGNLATGQQVNPTNHVEQPKHAEKKSTILRIGKWLWKHVDKVIGALILSTVLGILGIKQAPKWMHPTTAPTINKEGQGN